MSSLNSNNSLSLSYDLIYEKIKLWLYSLQEAEYREYLDQSSSMKSKLKSQLRILYTELDLKHKTLENQRDLLQHDETKMRNDLNEVLLHKKQVLVEQTFLLEENKESILTTEVKRVVDEKKKEKI